jgi:hypothetical protein
VVSQDYILNKILKSFYYLELQNKINMKSKENDFRLVFAYIAYIDTFFKCFVY